MNWLITGANGHLGRKLIEVCGGQHRIVALVRSERALQQLSGLPCEAVITDYRNVGFNSRTGHAGCRSMGCAYRPPVPYVKGQRLLRCSRIGFEFLGLQRGFRLALRLAHICGADASAANEVSSRGVADEIRGYPQRSRFDSKITDDSGRERCASRALANKARGMVFSFRADSLEQPIAASDVIAAIQAAIHGQTEGCSI